MGLGVGERDCERSCTGISGAPEVERPCLIDGIRNLLWWTGVAQASPETSAIPIPDSPPPQ